MLIIMTVSQGLNGDKLNDDTHLNHALLSTLKYLL